LHLEFAGRWRTVELQVDSKLLIDAIVRQTTVLIAALSTAAGIRAPLAHVADQVFLDLAKEIEAQGVGRKVVADMFGLALRTYQQKVRRLAESASQRDRSLWEALYQHLVDQGEQAREAIERHFHRDSVEDVGAVLHDLSASGLVQVTGRGRDALYRASSAGARARDLDALASLVWVAVYRRVATDVPGLVQSLGARREDVEAALEQVIRDGRVERDERGDLRAAVFVVPLGEKRGWEAAVFDHFGAVASAIASKVQRGPGSRAGDRVGGATLSFDVSPGHPYEAEVYGLLARIRTDVNELWSRAEKVKVTFYFGQNVEQDGSVSPSDEDEHG
jgi:hypothetical protein